MARLRILDVQGRVPYPLHDGGALGMWIVTEMLSRHPDIEYALVAMNTARHWVEPEKIPDIYRSIPHWWARVDNRITPHGVLANLLGSKPYHISRFVSPAFAELLTSAIRSFRPDVVLLQGLPLTHYVPAIRSATDAAIVYHAHNVEHRIWQRLVAAESNRLKRLYLAEQVRRLERYERAILTDGSLDAVVTFTRTDAEAIRSLGFSGAVHVKPFAVPLKKYHPSYAPETVPTLFHIGSLEWQPNRNGIEWFVREVLPQVQREFPGAEFHVAGSLPERYRLPTSAGVVVHGRVPDAAQFMQQRSVLVVPLRAGSGVRVKIIEAMAIGKAIVSTSIGAEGIECEPDRDMLIADTTEDFARCVCRLLGDLDAIETLGRNARRFAETNHDLLTVGGKLADFLSQVAARRRSAPAA
jgi:glycosyltransferase involved in cell wall biosynthesis